MRHGSLFNGKGGFQLAAAWIGWENVMSCEIDDFCNMVTKFHFPNCVQHGDIKTTDFAFWKGRLDIITGGIPASLILWQAWERAKKMTVSSGRKCFEQFGSRNALGLLTKMLLAQFPTASLTSRSMIWKVSATPANRIVFRLKRSGHYINGEEFGLSLITPTSTEIIKSPENYKAQKKGKYWKRNGTKFTSLGSQLIYGLLIPTPTLNDSKNATLPKSQKYSRKGYQGTLVSALMHMGISAGTKLNPELYECLMGYPKGWTIPTGTNVLKHPETQ